MAKTSELLEISEIPGQEEVQTLLDRGGRENAERGLRDSLIIYESFNPLCIPNPQTVFVFARRLTEALSNVDPNYLPPPDETALEQGWQELLKIYQEDLKPALLMVMREEERRQIKRRKGSDLLREFLRIYLDTSDADRLSLSSDVERLWGVCSLPPDQITKWRRAGGNTIIEQFVIRLAALEVCLEAIGLSIEKNSETHHASKV